MRRRTRDGTGSSQNILPPEAQGRQCASEKKQCYTHTTITLGQAMNKETHEADSNPKNGAGPWDAAALAKLSEWDPAWAGICAKMTTSPWTAGVLPRKFIELVGIAVNAACTSLNPEATRRHIRAALDAGATRDEVLMVLKMASVMSIHSCSLGAPILLEEARAAGAKPAAKRASPTPACDKMRVVGQWNTAWDPFLELDPV